MRTVPLGLQSNDRDFESLSVERLINCYIEQSAQSSVSPVPIVGTPGHDLEFTVGTGPIRGAIRWNGNRYIVSGSELYKVTDSNEATVLGSVAGTGQTDLRAMRSAVVFVSGGRYYHTDGVTLTDQALPAFVGIDGASLTPGSLTVINGSAIIGFKGTDQYTWTQPNEPDNIDGVDIATAERKTDETIRVYSDNNELLLFGRDSLEIKYDSGQATGRWQSVGSGLVERGCSAFGSIATMDNTTVWLGDDLSLYRLNGRSPQRISTHWFEYQVQRFSTVSDAVAFGHTWNGHKFYTISFPSEGRTFCIDLNTGLPHERRTWGLPYYRGCVSVPGMENQSLIGSAFDGQVLRQSEDVYQESGDYIERLVRTPYLYSENGEPLAVSLVGLIMDTGRAVQGTDLSESDLMMRYTNDGRNWSSERTESLGDIGRYGIKVRWRQLGQSQTGRRAFEFRQTASVPFRIVRGFASVDVGQS